MLLPFKRVKSDLQFSSTGFDNAFDAIEAPIVLPNGTLEGSIVLIPIGSPPEDVTRKYQAMGVAGVVMFGTSEGKIRLIFYLIYFAVKCAIQNHF